MEAGIFHIAGMLIGVSAIAFIVSHSQQSVEVVKGVGSTFGGLIGVATLQNTYGNAFGV